MCPKLKKNKTKKNKKTKKQRLYDKARDENTRIEELLRKFLDGVNDEKARFHVEYIKEPNNIDEAVRQMVHFQEMFPVRTKYFQTKILQTCIERDDE